MVFTWPIHETEQRLTEKLGNIKKSHKLLFHLNNGFLHKLIQIKQRFMYIKYNETFLKINANNFKALSDKILVVFNPL